MAKQVPTPSAGGSYLFNPETGELQLIESPSASNNNGTDEKKVSGSKDRVVLRDGSDSSGGK